MITKEIVQERLPIEKRCGVDFKNTYGALTLEPGEVQESKDDGKTGVFTRTHDDGWTITGEVHEDYYMWVNDFKANHPVYGRVQGNFEDSVYADSEEGFAHFYANHKPTEWDYMDI